MTPTRTYSIRADGNRKIPLAKFRLPNTAHIHQLKICTLHVNGSSARTCRDWKGFPLLFFPISYLRSGPFVRENWRHTRDSLARSLFCLCTRPFKRLGEFLHEARFRGFLPSCAGREYCRGCRVDGGQFVGIVLENALSSEWF